MSDELGLSVSIIIIFLVFIWDKDRSMRNHRKEFNRVADIASESHQLLEKSLDARDAERLAWVAERQQLLDRIQAPSFAEFKQAEIKTTKLQLGVKDPPPLEVL